MHHGITIKEDGSAQGTGWALHPDGSFECSWPLLFGEVGQAPSAEPDEPSQIRRLDTLGIPEKRASLHRVDDGRPAREVTLNGALVTDVVMADTLLGIVEFYERAKWGTPLGEAKPIRRYGKVRVTFKEGA